MPRSSSTFLPASDARLRNAMTFKTLAVFTMMAATTVAAHAQGIYRSVGPDGQVSYSDQPAAGAAKMSAGGRAGQAPAAESSAGGTGMPGGGTGARAGNAGAQASSSAHGSGTGAHGSSTSAASGRGAAPLPGGSASAASARGASGAGVPAIGAAALATSDGSAAQPGVRSNPKQAGVRLQPIDEQSTRAMVKALGYDVLVQRTAAVCGQASPDSHRRYLGIADAWRKRNDIALESARRSLSTGFTDEQRRLIELDLKIKADNGLSKVTAAQPAHRIAWCERSFGEISNGALDVKSSPVTGLTPAAGSTAMVDTRAR